MFGRGRALVATKVACVAVITVVALSGCTAINNLNKADGTPSELATAQGQLQTRGLTDKQYTGYSDGNDGNPAGYSFTIQVKNCIGTAVVDGSDVKASIPDSSGKVQTLPNPSAVQIRQDKRFKYCTK